MTAAASSLPACLLAETTVIQPTHLEGDPTLATEILPGPPSLASIRQAPKKGDPKRPPVPLSYLPLYDPGTTYSGLIGGMATLDDGGSRRKRARVDSRFSSRSQRASARGLTNPPLPHVLNSAEDDLTTTSQPMSEPIMIPSSNGDDIMPTSYSSSNQIAEENPVKNKVGRPKKAEQLGVTKEKGVVSVKEEPLSMQLSDITPRNDDHCSSCTSTGALVYCDGCPRAFHLWCLDPPMEASELSDGDRWFCPRCRAADAPSLRLPPSFFSPLVHQVHNSIPREFQLPEEIRSYFRDVATAPNGAYMDSSTIKPLRVGRHGIGAEEREPYRLRDGKGLCTLCFGCGKSTLPDELMPSTSSATDTCNHQWKSMISCDYCSLHWHLDCLDPPVTTMPPFGRKWKCPNHASNIAPKRRTPRNNTVIKDISGSNQYNNGNVEVINMEDSAFNQERLPADDVLINGTRYRVPERAIILDFWNKAQNPLFNRPPIDQASITSSSPLTSLTSLDDDDEQIIGDDTLAVAQMLCNMQKMTFRSTTKIENRSRIIKDIAIQTDPVTLQSQNSEILSNGLSEMLPSRSRQRSSILFGIDGESSPSRRSPKVSSYGKSQERVTRQRASRGNLSTVDGLQPDATADNTSYNISGSSIPGTPSNKDVKLTSLKIRIPVLTPKALPSLDRLNDVEMLSKDFTGSKKEFESSARPLSSRPFRTTRMKPLRPAAAAAPDSSSSHSELTSNEDDSRNNSEVIGKGAAADDSDFNVEQTVSSRVPTVDLQTRDDTPRKRRRIPSLSSEKNEGSSSAVDVSPLIGKSGSSRASSRGRRLKRTTRGRKTSSVSVQRSELVKSNSISNPLIADEESDLMAGNFNSTPLGQSAIPIASLS